MGLIGDFARAIGQLTDRSFVGVLAVSLGLTLLILIALAVLAGWVTGFLPDTFTLPWIGELTTPETGLQGLAVGGVLVLSVFLMIPVAVIFVNIFLDSVAAAVERKHYPDDPPGREQGIVEGLGTAVAFTGVVILANLVGLVLYLVSGPLAPLVFYAVNGYLLGREYFQTVAYRYLGKAEAAALRKRHGGQAMLAGTLMAVPLTVPVLNLIVPLVGVATFVHTVKRLMRAETRGRG